MLYMFGIHAYTNKILFEPTFICQRILMKTYGVQTKLPFDKELHEGKDSGSNVTR